MKSINSLRETLPLGSRSIRSSPRSVGGGQDTADDGALLMQLLNYECADERLRLPFEAHDIFGAGSRSLQ